MMKAKALCLFRNQERILLSKSYDPTKQEYFLRPIGGSIEFGETSLHAVIREIREEINAEVKNIELVQVYENIFNFDGRQGHEIVFLYQADFVATDFYQQDHIPAIESDGAELEVRWFTPSEILNYPVYPDGVLSVLLPQN